MGRRLCVDGSSLPNDSLKPGNNCQRGVLFLSYLIQIARLVGTQPFVKTLGSRLEAVRHCTADFRNRLCVKHPHSRSTTTFSNETPAHIGAVVPWWSGVNTGGVCHVKGLRLPAQPGLVAEVPLVGCLQLPFVAVYVTRLRKKMVSAVFEHPSMSKR